MTRKSMLCLSALALAAASAVTASAAGKDDFPPFADVSKGFRKVVSTADGQRPLYGIWVNDKTNQMLAELPSGYGGQKHYIAVTQASGAIFAGLQGPSRYVYWKRFDKRMALIEPELGTRSTGEAQSRSSVERLFTDRVLIDVPIVTMGPSGQPVIDLDELLVNRAGTFLGRSASGINSRLATVSKAKAFPQNVEITIEAPVSGGRLVKFHYSISRLPNNTGYKPRVADERIGYFTTVYRDLGKYKEDEKWVRYINRWHLQKRDPKLKMSPPKEPLIYYLEHTVPVRYRRWLREGILYWNKAFENVGLDSAIEVYYQDKTTGAHMDKDPEDVRYNFIRWLNNDISTAIGPSRAHPLTGQILDADVVLTDGWIRAFWGWLYEQGPELAAQSMTPDTLRWLEDYPDWDPRLLLSSPEQRDRIMARRAERKHRLETGELLEPLYDDPILEMNDDLAEIETWLGHDHRQCLAAHGLASHMAFARLNLEALDLIEQNGNGEEGDILDDIPEWFVGPMVADLVCHEVGHTLGLRHNFKASSIYTLEEINSGKMKGKKPFTSSVMDYNPPNFNMESGEIQGDFAMIGVGPYDMWAIEYGYTFDDPKKVLKRVAEPELAYQTDDDVSGPDPFARTYDFSANPLDYAENQMRLVNYHRGRILEKYVKDGQSWSRARRGYEATLMMQLRMTSMMANWIGGAYVSRARKGDPEAGPPTVVVEAEKQRAALKFIIDNMFNDEAFGLSPELLAHMTVDKWSDQSPGDRGDPTWPVHDRVLAMQASTLSMILNPTTLKRVYDNEFRTPADEDALTLAELLQNLSDAVYTELLGEPDGDISERNPMISSLRRNLQSAMTGRLVSLALEGRSMPRSVRTLASMHLREIDGEIQRLLYKDNRPKLDAYTEAHLVDLHERIDKALNAIQVTNDR